MKKRSPLSLFHHSTKWTHHSVLLAPESHWPLVAMPRVAPLTCCSLRLFYFATAQARMFLDNPHPTPGHATLNLRLLHNQTAVIKEVTFPLHMAVACEVYGLARQHCWVSWRQNFMKAFRMPKLSTSALIYSTNAIRKGTKKPTILSLGHRQSHLNHVHYKKGVYLGKTNDTRLGETCSAMHI